MKSDDSSWFTRLDDGQCSALAAELVEEERGDLTRMWELSARPEQLPPDPPWTCWLICAGRGFGKTRTGAEWVRRVAAHSPNARIALVAASLGEARAIMVEGESGLLTISPPHRRPDYEPSLRKLTFDNGAQAFLYSAAEPDSLRGPQHSHAWCDEIGKWDSAGNRAQQAWDNLVLGLRLGDAPRVVATTTPRATPLLRKLLDQAEQGEVTLTSGTTFANRAHLPQPFLRWMEREYGGTALGRQELHGEMLTDIEGALWSRELLERCRETGTAGDWVRVVVGVDPPASAQGDACGIIVAALDSEGVGAVLADCSVARASPERWARAAARAAQLWQAERVVAEANQGGAMVASVLRAADIALPLKLVHASRGKTARAEPVAALYEAGRVHHAGTFPLLEDELCGLMVGGQYEGPGRSPDRADALVWALTELMLTPVSRPSVRHF